MSSKEKQQYYSCSAEGSANENWTTESIQARGNYDQQKASHWNSLPAQKIKTKA